MSTQAERDREKIMEMIHTTADLMHVLVCPECAQQIRDQAELISRTITSTRMAIMMRKPGE